MNETMGAEVLLPPIAGEGGRVGVSCVIALQHRVRLLKGQVGGRGPRRRRICRSGYAFVLSMGEDDWCLAARP